MASSFCTVEETRALLDEYIRVFGQAGSEPDAEAIAASAEQLRIGVAFQLRRLLDRPGLVAAVQGRYITPGQPIAVMGDWFETTPGPDSAVVFYNLHPNIDEDYHRDPWGRKGHFCLDGLILGRSGSDLRMELVLGSPRLGPRLGKVVVHHNGEISFAGLELRESGVLPFSLGFTPTVRYEFYPVESEDVTSLSLSSFRQQLPELWAYLRKLARHE